MLVYDNFHRNEATSNGSGLADETRGERKATNLQNNSNDLLISQQPTATGASKCTFMDSVNDLYVTNFQETSNDIYVSMESTAVRTKN